MDQLIQSLSYPIGFAVVLGIVVFVHEFGHYWVARRCGVTVETFSIGFGPEIFGWTARSGTRWKVSLLPLGGYVKMYGDANASSAGGSAADDLENGKVSFQGRPLKARAAIVAAGPVFNFIYAIVALAALYMIWGQQTTPAVIGTVVESSPAAAAGLQPGDRVVGIDGQPVTRFEELQTAVMAGNGAPVTLAVDRDGRMLAIGLTPEMVSVEDRFGNTHQMPRIGIAASGTEWVRQGPVEAIGGAARETVSIVVLTFTSVGEMIAGDRGTEELAGVIGIAQMSGEVVRMSVATVIWFTAMLSINLGLINLLPVPLLDGGHLAFYAAEAVRGRPLSQRSQEYGFRLGLVLVLTLMVVATWNDLVRLRVVDYLSGLFS
ncbi:zinc metalloprotease [Tistrella bauzanensis]|uniref:Zinc metalloprotease n=1 Tax=Tistrella bauzanensis TaxID=657419 RepID=A0ABQ1IA12_9PROT|nr:RIP metalloprotease RseP [Tistrella bauzanensis]GGB30468.1 zinc metalloprotease [Tistrella bauzanensis]